jgi:PadR family transcriptional regulator, regulatory protein PadR
MDKPERVTQPLLDVLEVLWESDEAVHGHEIKKRTKRTGPTVYNNLDRLQRAGWIAGRWERDDPQSGRPRRRVYQLTPEGWTLAEDLLVRAGRIQRGGGLRPADNPGGNL